MGGITGTVTNRWDEPIYEVLMKLYLESGFVSSIRTDEDGIFLFDDLNPGTYYVRANHDDYQTEWWNDKGSPEEADPIEVAGGLIENIDFELALTWDGKLKRAKSVFAELGSICQRGQNLANVFLSNIFDGLQLTQEQKDALKDFYANLKTELQQKFGKLP